MRVERNALVVQLGDPTGQPSGPFSAQVDGEQMADEFTFLGVAAGIGLVLLMILLI